MPHHHSFNPINKIQRHTNGGQTCQSHHQNRPFPCIVNRNVHSVHLADPLPEPSGLIAAVNPVTKAYQSIRHQKEGRVIPAQKIFRHIGYSKARFRKQHFREAVNQNCVNGPSQRSYKQNPQYIMFCIPCPLIKEAHHQSKQGSGAYA